MKLMPDCSVQCVVTSPPYWSLRDYQVEGQYGLEETPEAHVAKMVEVFREVRRILRDDATLWLNYGDSYVGSPGGNMGPSASEGDQLYERKWKHQHCGTEDGEDAHRKVTRQQGILKQKDLVGMPWRVAFALQADGWWLRQDIIWHKPNPMPESVTDRCTKSHEYLFLMAKSAHYYFDAEAIREEHSPASYERAKYPTRGNTKKSTDKTDERVFASHFNDLPLQYNFAAGRNRRSVWTIATEPCKEAHFATFPRKLVEPCIRAGTSEKGCCPKCGKPWERITQVHKIPRNELPKDDERYRPNRYADNKYANEIRDGYECGMYSETKTLGWQPSCECGLDPVPCMVFDPFSGSGTVGLVALPLGRNYIGIELNPAYVEMSRRRLLNECGLIAKETTND
jgi:DNA modification methylase